MLGLWMKARPLPRAQAVIWYPVHGRSTAGIWLLHFLVREPSSSGDRITAFFGGEVISFHAHCMLYAHLHAPGLVTMDSL